MSLFNWWKDPVPDPCPEVIEVSANDVGRIFPVKDARNVIFVKKVPEPDLSTKPADRVYFMFGWACESQHVSGPFVDAVEKIEDETRLCPTCGNMPLRKAVVKRTNHAEWNRDPYSVLFSHAVYSWSFRWSVYLDEFVHFLDNKKPRPRRRKK